MTPQINYDQIASKTDYTSLNRKLESLKLLEATKTRKRVADALKPLLENLRDLRAKGWTYGQLASQLNAAGMPIKESTLREYLFAQAKRDRKASVVKT